MAKPKTVAGTAADPVVRYTPLEIDGSTYRLAYDFNAIAQVEQSQGVNLLKNFMVSELNASSLRGILYAGLLKAHPEMTMEDAGRLIHPRNINSILETVVRAYEASMPEKKEAAAGEALAVAS
jgi:hypothetical protein